VSVFGHAAAGGRVVTGDHWLDVPLVATPGDAPATRRGQAPEGGTVRVYAREVRAEASADSDLPYLVFLQGGPGHRAPRPGPDAPAWLGRALERYRVLLLDQRGTGRSSPQELSTLAGLAPAARAERLACFGADAVVADAEALRRHLLGDVPWTVLGQSFGGFCTWTYLSFAPDGLAEAYVTGGIPPVGVHPDAVYAATTRAVERRTADLDAAHPRARVVLAEVARHVERVPEHLPTGERLTVARLQELGSVLGGVNGPDLIAQLAEDAWALPGERLSQAFLAGVAGVVSYWGRPLYALLHEAIYAEGGTATRWSAQRVRNAQGVPVGPVAGPDGEERLPLTGEMVFPGTVRSDPALAPLAETAELLAQRHWDRRLYDPARLAANRVPVAACLYTQDMYVDPELSRATAAATAGVRVVEDAVHHHNGLRRAGADVLGRLEEAIGSGPREDAA
jgi:pimeloyl-ACP methyl ester carboxylesterase